MESTDVIRQPNDEAAWAEVARHWTVPEGITYLNHGAFGYSPDVVREECRRWAAELVGNPMDFYIRQYEPALKKALQRVAEFVGAPVADLAPVQNATDGMNEIAMNMPLSPGDEVVLTDHGYGAVQRIWDRACRQAGAKLVIAEVPTPAVSDEQLYDAVLNAVTDNTRIIVLSHVTSPTAVKFPVEAICQAARERGIRTAIDGPHAVAVLDLNIAALDCDYYTTSCHKWMLGPLGSGFLYVHPRCQAGFSPLNLSWGRLGPASPEDWRDEHFWPGTRDFSPLLSLPTAIDLIESIGLDSIRGRFTYLAKYAREAVQNVTGLPAFADENLPWQLPIVSMELPPGDWFSLREALKTRFGIESQVAEWNGRRLFRASCYLYNDTAQLDYVADSLRAALADE